MAEDSTEQRPPLRGFDPQLDAFEWDNESNRPRYADYCIKLIKQERQSVIALLSEARRLMEERPSSSENAPFMKDWELAEGDSFVSGGHAYAVEHFQSLMRAIENYVETFVLTLHHERLIIQSGWSLTRGAMEAVLTSCWMIDSKVSADMRIARALSLLPANVQGSVTMFAKFPTNPEAYEEKRRARAELIKFYKANRCEVLWKVDKQGNPTDLTNAVLFRDCKAPFTRNMTQLAEAYLPDDPHLYSLLSGASHSEGWLLNGINPTHVGEALNSVVMPLFQVSEGYIRSMCAYFGLDEKPYVTRTHRRLMGLTLRGETQAHKPDVQTAFGVQGRGFAHEFARKRPFPSSVPEATDVEGEE